MYLENHVEGDLRGCRPRHDRGRILFRRRVAGDNHRRPDDCRYGRSPFGNGPFADGSLPLG